MISFEFEYYRFNKMSGWSYIDASDLVVLYGKMVDDLKEWFAWTCVRIVLEVDQIAYIYLHLSIQFL